ncbi:membrane-anchored ubiquitin-fold protein 3-like isoform X1 [Hibiscus syriacus]|uniref:Membrane-anchored ubiquitin-fold protein 3-like isoform X1 n=1 Tax=Hibiscus syriacus TaxID=106335 RepID=A0A6A3ATZ8_HIBSY|nr:membrane-anchored ubiquitin-fold protein 3-like isoform X1 [Hibiscus syriacus]
MSDERNKQIRRRLCDYCDLSTALLYCRADSAKLCFSCDREVHSANQLFTKHCRSQLCDACHHSPASVFCETEQFVFCSNCDWENHKLPSSSLHNRRPIEVFTGCPSVSKLGCGDGAEDCDGLLDLSNWESPVISGFDGLILPSDFDHGFKPTDVPPLPKNRNSSCGQHKEEIFHQLHELAKSEPNLSLEKANVEAIIGFQSLIPDADNFQPGGVQISCRNDEDPIPFPAFESSPLQCFKDNNVELANQAFLPFSQLRGHAEENAVVPNKHEDSSRNVDVNISIEDQRQHQIVSGTTLAPPTVAVHELNSQERDSAISRYKEKKKTRRYDKQIKYESRKARAESRTRIRGRFAKVQR